MQVNACQRVMPNDISRIEKISQPCYISHTIHMTEICLEARALANEGAIANLFLDDGIILSHLGSHEVQD